MAGVVGTLLCVLVLVVVGGFATSGAVNSAFLQGHSGKRTRDWLRTHREADPVSELDWQETFRREHAAGLLKVGGHEDDFEQCRLCVRETIKAKQAALRRRCSHLEREQISSWDGSLAYDVCVLCGEHFNY